jgi:hypothetical protein
MATIVADSVTSNAWEAIVASTSEASLGPVAGAEERLSDA